MVIGMNGMEQQESLQRRQLRFVLGRLLLCGGCAGGVTVIYGAVQGTGAERWASREEEGSTPTVSFDWYQREAWRLTKATVVEEAAPAFSCNSWPPKTCQKAPN